MKKIRFLYKYISHFFDSKNTKGHGIHSPYLYRFTQNAIYEKNPFYIFPEIETLRENLKYDDRMISIKDYGTGADRQARVQDIAKTSLKRPKWAQMLYRIVNFTKAKNVLELGTSLGLTTAYLASVKSDIQCLSLEGGEEIAGIARENFEKLDIYNIEVVVGDIDLTLEPVLERMNKLDVVFFDANHREEPVLKYFLQCLEHIHMDSVFVFDGIHWSDEMEHAWRKIRKNSKVTTTIDLFEFGIVFFNKNYPKKNYKMFL
ncbi:MAG: O-methyltransferase [Paludibacteraceae bacterium]